MRQRRKTAWQRHSKHEALDESREVVASFPPSRIASLLAGGKSKRFSATCAKIVAKLLIGLLVSIVLVRAMMMMTMMVMMVTIMSSQSQRLPNA